METKTLNNGLQFLTYPKVIPVINPINTVKKINDFTYIRGNS